MTTRFVFVVEQTLGNAVHGRNIERALARRDDIEATMFRLEQSQSGVTRRIPVLRTWSFQASTSARRELRRILKHGGPDAALIHTQVASLLSVGFMRAVPTVISLDATPVNYDSLGASYGHRRQAEQVESWKRRINQRALSAAHAIITFSRWAANSVVDDYGIPQERVTVIRPGVDLHRFRPRSGARRPGPPRVLFVGADFARKGGNDLLEAMQHLGQMAELDVVTATPVRRLEGIPMRVHMGLTHGSERLFDLYRNADIFAFPSHGDCSPHAVSEAVACGLPVVACDVGAIGEVAVHGRNALLVPPNAPDQLARALLELVEHPELHRAFSAQGLDLARHELDAARNVEEVFELMGGLSRVFARDGVGSCASPE